MARKNVDGRTVKVITAGGTNEPVDGVYSDRLALSVRTAEGTTIETGRSLTDRLLQLTSGPVTAESHRKLNQTVDDLNRLTQAQGKLKVGSPTLTVSRVPVGLHIPRAAAQTYTGATLSS